MTTVTRQKLKFHPDFVAYPHGYEEMKNKDSTPVIRKGKALVISHGQRMPHLVHFTFEKLEEYPDGKVRVEVIANEPYTMSCGATTVRVKKNELVGAAYVFDADCFVPV